MIPTYLSLATAVLAATSGVPAQDPKVSSPTPVKYELKNRSAFTAQDSTRPPFWPIGWVKRGASMPVMAPAAPRVTLDEKAFVVSSILLGNPSLAVVNGRSYREGEFLRLPRGADARIQVLRILDGGVQFKTGDQLFVTKLHRPEIEGKKPEESLLLDER
jgi:hypothetical protein